MELVIEHGAEIIQEKEEIQSKKKLSIIDIPKDKFYMGYVMFLLLGITHMLPITFLSVANNFWMYKFRNTALSTYSPDDKRTDLQKFFASANVAISLLPGLIFATWNVWYGHRFKLMNRLFVILSIDTVIFLFFAISVKINTDKFQTAFFAIVLSFSAVLFGANSLNKICSTILYPRFPRSYMKTALIGEGVAGLITDFLNVVLVSLFDELTDSSLMYFVCGTALMFVTLMTLVLVSRTKFFKYHLSSIPEDTSNKDMMTLKEVATGLSRIKASAFTLSMFIISMGCAFPSVASLIISEKSGTVWAEKYFSPVSTFLLYDCFALFGQFLSSHILPFKPTGRLTVTLAILRGLIFVPGIWFCNVNGKNHVPTYFPHDYQYAIILGLFALVGGYTVNACMLIITRDLKREEAEVSFKVFGLFSEIVQAISSPVGILIVKLL